MFSLISRTRTQKCHIWTTFQQTLIQSRSHVVRLRRINIFFFTSHRMLMLLARRVNLPNIMPHPIIINVTCVARQRRHEPRLSAWQQYRSTARQRLSKHISASAVASHNNRRAVICAWSVPKAYREQRKSFLVVEATRQLRIQGREWSVPLVNCED
jgi:hypothetical protein